jgi:hypothetical protein
METKIKLTGPKAVGALVVIVAVVAFQFLNRQQTLETEAIGEIKLLLASEYTRHHLPELQKAAQDGQFDAARAEEITSQLSMDNIEIVDIRARGRDAHYVARVEVTVNGADPPVGGRVRYFRMTHSTLAGWRVLGESSKWSYYLAF